LIVPLVGHDCAHALLQARQAAANQQAARRVTKGAMDAILFIKGGINR
jgi:hypothetical protein